MTQNDARLFASGISGTIVSIVLHLDMHLYYLRVWCPSNNNTFNHSHCTDRPNATLRVSRSRTDGDSISIRTVGTYCLKMYECARVCVCTNLANHPANYWLFVVCPFRIGRANALQPQRHTDNMDGHSVLGSNQYNYIQCLRLWHFVRYH